MGLSKHLGNEEQNKNETIAKLFITEDTYFYWLNRYIYKCHRTQDFGTDTLTQKVQN